MAALAGDNYCYMEYFIIMGEVLSSQQVDALQAVDLRIGWVWHGTAANSDYGFPPENGPAVYGVADTDYAVPAALLSDMGSGDISARERIPGQGWWGEAPRNVDILSDVNWLLLRSPYVDRSPLLDVKDYDDLFYQIRNSASPAAIHNIPALRDGLTTSIDILRNLRIGGPFVYLDGLAAVKGIRRVIADSPDKKFKKGKISIEQRNSDMARALGSAAVGLAGTSNNGDVPKVAFTAGAGHKEMEEILDSYGVAYSRMVAKRPLADKLFDLRGFFRKQSKLDTLFAQHCARSWFKNLRQQGHTPINETLGEIRFRV